MYVYTCTGMHAHIPGTCLLSAHTLISFHCLDLLMDDVVIPCPAKEFKYFIVTLGARLLRGPRNSARTPGVAAAGGSGADAR